MKRDRFILAKLAWLSLGFFLFLYLSVSHSPDSPGEEEGLPDNEEVKSVLEACRSLKEAIKSSEYPYAESQYSPQYLFSPPKMEMLKINTEHKISICVPYKAGSETWRYLVESLSNSSEPLENIEQMKDYMKAIQVRDPYERLLSAYRFIFSGGNVLRDNLQLSKHLMEHYKDHQQDQDTSGRPVASFAQFLQSIVTGYQDLPHHLHHLLTEGAAMHWLPYYVQCNPCHPDYRPDHVININTWEADTTAFLNTAGINTNRCILHYCIAESIRDWHSSPFKVNVEPTAHEGFNLIEIFPVEDILPAERSSWRSLLRPSADATILLRTGQGNYQQNCRDLSHRLHTLQF